jgi:hypothetical protein
MTEENPSLVSSLSDTVTDMCTIISAALRVTGGQIPGNTGAPLPPLDARHSSPEVQAWRR